jgi:hypothetical protein
MWHRLVCREFLASFLAIFAGEEAEPSSEGRIKKGKQSRKSN